MNYFNELNRMRKEMDKYFDFWQPEYFFKIPRTSFMENKISKIYPLINITEDKNNLYIEALTPGVNTETLEVNVTNNVLTISGEKPENKDIKIESYHRVERTPGKFARHFELPCEINANEVKADYSNGILSITMPKSEKAKPKQINISIN